MNYYYKLALVIISTSPLFAQSNITLEGTIIDAKTKDPLPFSHIYFENTSFGTVANADGIFQLVFPMSYLEKRIVVSSMGFKSAKLTVEDFNHLKDGQIKLEESPIQLEGIIISTYTAKEIWKKAIKQYNKLYSTPDYRAQGFYRTTFQEDGYFTRLLEAAVNIHGGGSPKSRPDIEYVEMRKSEDLRQNIWKIYDGYLEHLVYNHPIRSRYNFLTGSGMNRYEFEITEQLYRDEDLYYKINATGPEKGMFDVEMLIRDRDYAIFQITVFFHPENSNNFSWAWEYREEAKFYCDWQTSIYEYDEFEGKMFLKRSSWHRKGKVIERESGETLFLTESIDELLITKIDLGVFPKSNKVPEEVQNVYEMANYFEYNPKFWQSYNRPVDSEYFKTAKSKMEGYMPLEEQYLKNTGLRSQ